MGRHREPSAPQQPARPTRLGRRATTMAMGASALLVAGVTVGVVQTLGAPPATLSTDTNLSTAAYAPAKFSWPTAKPTGTAAAREGRSHRKHRHRVSPAPTAPSSTAPVAEPSTTAPASAEPSSTGPSSDAPSSAAPSATAPASTEPASTEPSATAPSSTAPSSAEPSATAPASTEPSSTAPVSAEPSAPASSAPASSAPTSTAPAAAPSSTTPAAGTGTIAQQVVDLTNAERAKAGCQPLSVNATLTSVAQAHSADMAANGYFDHADLSGRSPFDRMTAAGYSFRTAGENIAAGQTSPSAVVTAWMNSAGHRANILNCSFTEIGVGYVTGGSYRYYWTQDFGTPR